MVAIWSNRPGAQPGSGIPPAIRAVVVCEKSDNPYTGLLSGGIAQDCRTRLRLRLDLQSRTLVM